MPANIAHILIAHTAYKKQEKLNPDIHDYIMSKNNLFYLGSLGPDLPSYKTSKLIEAAFNQLLIRPFVDQLNPQEEDASFFLHSTHANLFPFYLMETNFSFADMENGEVVTNDFNAAVYAFTLGYVTHVAADQIIHRLVRELIGPYYRNLETSQKHSECEVYQDVFLLAEIKKNINIDKVLPTEIINIDKLGFDVERFCNMYSLAISKAGYTRMDREYIASWINGMQFAFDKMDDLGPIAKAMKHYEEHKDKIETSPYYRLYYKNDITKLNYRDYFDKAVDISITYMNEIARLWNGKDFSLDSFNKYQHVISTEDLTSPLRKL
ncbi:MAG: zinc dependent phospholipase C family protein [Bacteroidota bacterium]